MAGRLRAIDLYSGVGGWSLGLRLAGIDVVASYEVWGAANETNFKNNAHQTQTIDIRRLSLGELPKKIDVVVGSPPCTQFSLSNRGGGGDISDGLKDIVKFLTIVDHLRPKLWVMENVPRVEGILKRELLPGGALAKFRHLKMATTIVNMEDYGLPQRRRRCLVGNLNFDLLESYASNRSKLTLGAVIKALNSDPAVDPLFGTKIRAKKLTDHVFEDALSEEEVRINRAAKSLHPVYNSMVFPDSLERSVRTLTATCTRVSRESIIVEASCSPQTYRRLTIRERACLQGFPICFQLYGASFSEKIKMVGNAFPPAFAYYVGHAIRGTTARELPLLKSHKKKLIHPVPPAAETPPHKAGARFPLKRRFWFAIPSLRLKSGVRFELGNLNSRGEIEWHIAFYFGTSKSIQSIALDDVVHRRVMQALPMRVHKQLRTSLSNIKSFMTTVDLLRMQNVWTHRGPGGTSPFELLDFIDATAKSVSSVLQANLRAAQEVLGEEIALAFGSKVDAIPGKGKLSRHADQILAGVIVGSLVNSYISDLTRTLRAPHRTAIARRR